VFVVAFTNPAKGLSIKLIKLGLPVNHIYEIVYYIIEGSLEVKLPIMWTDGKQRWEESEKRKSQ